MLCPMFYSESEFSSCISQQDKQLKTVAEGKGTKSMIKISQPKLWWPYLMHEDPGYLYTMKITLTKGTVVDVYRSVKRFCTHIDIV